MDNLSVSFDRNSIAGCTSFSFESTYQNLEISDHAKIYQFPKVADAVKIDYDNLTLNNDNERS